MKKKDLDLILDQYEQAELTNFASNTAQVEAVKKLLNFKLYQLGVIQKGKKPIHLTENVAFSIVSNYPNLKNEQIGEHLRALWEGAKLLEQAFDDILLYKQGEERSSETEENPAR